ncbi:MAG: DUF3103 domain-containing protein [Bacteroidales bacterium]|nr:DUF3103 domain-containing protein [Bacteroidales bacterium]
MKKLKRIVVAIMAVTALFSACQKNEITQEKNQDATQEMDLREVAVSLVEFLNEGNNYNEMIAYLGANKYGNTLEHILDDVTTSTENKAGDKLHDFVFQSQQINLKASETGLVQTPELWMFQPKGANENTKVLISYVPKGNEKDWKSIEAFDLDMNKYQLDPLSNPNYKVIVVDANAMASMKIQVKLMNEELQKAGLQKNLAAKKVSMKTSGGLETTKLTKIRLKWDEEPWIKGAAEVYAITSGLRGSENNKEPEISIIGMPYLDYEEENYYPNQIMLFWDDYAFQAANIQLFEQDSNYNYQELVGIIVDGLFDIATILYTEPWIPALGLVASAIIEVLPEAWYTDDDDYLDSFYTIMKNETYTNYMGAGNNAKVDMVPFFIPEN